jgi:DNA-binding ferritin-like protein
MNWMISRKGRIMFSAAHLKHSAVLACFLVVGCSSAYYGVWEKLGYEKRDILVSRIKSASKDQEEAKKQFQTTLEKFQEVTHFNGGDLEAEYKKLNGSYEACQSRADDVSKRIASVEKVAADMFAEWESELSQYSDQSRRNSSAQMLADTKVKYQKLIAVMKQAEKRMQPVLTVFHDQVLYLKHNLNAAAIASLKDTSAGIESDVSKLIQDMNVSIAEANTFISQMTSAK